MRFDASRQTGGGPPSRRQRTPRADSITSPARNATDAAWRAAVQSVDATAEEIEGVWGIARLERLVPPELAARFATAQFQLDEAIASGDVAAASAKASALSRGWHALDRAAREAGHVPEDPRRVWFHEAASGKRYAVALDEAEVVAVARKFPDHVAVSVAELVRLMETTRAGVFAQAVKQAFPGAHVAEPKPLPKGGDEIPF